MSLHLSIKNARVHQTRLLLEIGTNPNTPDIDSRTPLMLACLIDKQTIGVRIVRLLVDKGATISTKDQHNRTALSYACMTGKDKIVKILLEDVEYDINAKDDEGNTPLIYCAMSGNATALRCLLAVLLKYRLSVDLRNNKGFSAYLLATKMGHFYCAHILKAEGYASDGIRDSEYFLSDKEWMKKIRRETEKMKLEEREERLVSTRTTLSSQQARPACRPQTSIDYQRAQSNITNHYTPEWRPRTRLTNHSEPVRSLKYNSWIDVTEERSERSTKCSDATISESSFILIPDNSTCKTESVPSVARTKTHNLHAILSQYLDQEIYKPVKITPRVNTKVKITTDDSTKNNQPTQKQRKQSRLMSRQNTRKNLLG